MLDYTVNSMSTASSPSTYDELNMIHQKVQTPKCVLIFTKQNQNFHKSAKKAKKIPKNLTSSNFYHVSFGTSPLATQPFWFTSTSNYPTFQRQDYAELRAKGMGSLVRAMEKSGKSKQVGDVPLGADVGLDVLMEVRINGLVHLLINGVYWGYNPLILTFYSFFETSKRGEPKTSG